MDKIDKEIISSNSLKYLGKGRIPDDEGIAGAVSECVDMLDEEAHFRVCREIYSLTQKDGFFHIPELSVTLESEDTNIYFEGCDRICVILSTLGIETERFIRKIQMMDMAKGMILDTCAGASLERMTDMEESDLGDRTFRVCPGYGDLSLGLNEIFLRAINGTKRIGVTLTEGGLFVPQKSMLGLIGLGRINTNRSCGRCVRRAKCTFLAEGIRCWN